MSVLQEQGEVLVFVRYPNRGGAREYFILQHSDEFKALLDKTEAGDSVTVFRKIETLWSGLLTEETKPEILTALAEYDNHDLLLIAEEREPATKYGNDYVAVRLSELAEELDEFEHSGIRILLEQDFCDEEKVFHAYGPGWFGIGHPIGAY